MSPSSCFSFLHPVFFTLSSLPCLLQPVFFTLSSSSCLLHPVFFIIFTSPSLLHSPCPRNPASAQTTPRRSGDPGEEGEGAAAAARDLTDINANPRLHSTSTPQGGAEARGESRELDSVSPVAWGAGAGCGGADSSMATSSSEGSVELSQLYQDICDQKDVIMSCLEEDNCDIDQVLASP